MLSIGVSTSCFFAKEGKRKKDDEKAARSAVRGIIRALVSSSQHPSIASVSDPVLLSLSTCAGAAAVVEAFVVADLAGGIRFAAARDFVGADDVWIGDFLHRIHTDAVGSWIGDGVLRGRNLFESLHVGTLASLLRHGSGRKFPVRLIF
ncbi:hypothetical protein L484_004768 [Morus notabilis]|uniref:Uncharacterized protein n=1 Tax=Morus notabilis TaxID=981085 RepID=W9R2U8_9ROSA|nr:hypothetical protein L484_004768 [Morus notabilis]